ncbi:MAG: ATP-binding protein [Candidatus Cloacimonetes bacterium]|nr:ATP-binding protein [Candidatus Cloacimonadota bacterium]
MIKRTVLEMIPKFMYKGRAIIIYGARRTGKTTILKALAQGLEDLRFVNCDLIDGQEAFDFKTVDDILLNFGNISHLLIDEAQRVPDIGIKLKAIIDTLPKLQIIATGSSSLDLSNITREPLTGRKFEFLVSPFSTREIYDEDGIAAVKGGVEQRLVFGNYPEVYLEKTMPREIIGEIAGSYLFRDLLAFQDIKRPDLLKKLLKALALQLCNEVSYTELGSIVGLDRKTVERYIELMEQSFIIYRLGSFSRNLRNELKRAVKVYFWDNGIRNALLNNFSPLETRTDLGALWENYVVTERRKKMLNQRASFEHYFWRTSSQQEIDLIETENGNINAYEIKWKRRKSAKFPKPFLESYPEASLKLVDFNNYVKWLL